jgi:WD40 repeat protein
MIRFSLTQLFMAIALVAIVLTLVRSEGCGARMLRVSDVEFSPDGRRLAVARHDGRDARVPFKGYLANVSRTISVMDVASLSGKQVVEQRLKFGNQGPAFGIFRYAAPSLVFPSDDCLLVTGFGNGPLSEYIFHKKALPSSAPREIPSGGIWMNSKRTVLAAADPATVRILDPQTRDSIMQLQTGPVAFMDVALVALSADGNILATADWDGITLWPIAGGALAPLASIAIDHNVEALEFSPDGASLMVVRPQELAFFDLDGALLRNLKVPGRVLDARLSPDGKAIAIATEDGISTVNAVTMTPGPRMADSQWTLCLEYSPDGRVLAGGGHGWVATWDAATGQLRNWAYAPGRVRPPWTVPVAAFMVWLWAYRRIKTQPPSVPRQNA